MRSRPGQAGTEVRACPCVRARTGLHAGRYRPEAGSRHAGGSPHITDAAPPARTRFRPGQAVKPTRGDGAPPVRGWRAGPGGRGFTSARGQGRTQVPNSAAEARESHRTPNRATDTLSLGPGRTGPDRLQAGRPMDARPPPARVTRVRQAPGQVPQGAPAHGPTRARTHGHTRARANAQHAYRTLTRATQHRLPAAQPDARHPASSTPHKSRQVPPRQPTSQETKFTPSSTRTHAAGHAPGRPPAHHLTAPPPSSSSAPASSSPPP